MGSLPSQIACVGWQKIAMAVPWPPFDKNSRYVVGFNVDVIYKWVFFYCIYRKSLEVRDFDITISPMTCVGEVR